MGTKGTRYPLDGAALFHNRALGVRNCTYFSTSSRSSNSGVSHFCRRTARHNPHAGLLRYISAQNSPSMKCRYAPSSTMIRVCSNCPAPGALRRKIGLKRIVTDTPLWHVHKKIRRTRPPRAALQIYVPCGLTRCIKCVRIISAYSPCIALSRSV